MRCLQSARGLVACGMAVVAASVFVVDTMSGTEGSASTMASAANRFLESLSATQRAEATFAFDGEERVRFHFVPTEMHPRDGLTIRAMSNEQRAHAHDLLSAGLSQRGYLTATTIMGLEAILHELEQGGRFDRDPEFYFFSVFGTPSDEGVWGWRVEGHHLSVHFTVIDGVVAASAPTFVGANPAQVRSGPQAGLRTLRHIEDAARTLVEALDPSQRHVAVYDDVAPDDILTRAELTVEPLSPAGLKAATLRAEQRALLMELIEAYASLMADDIAAARLAQVEAAGVDDIGFAWAGSIERGEPHYYRVQGPTFLIEYDNTQGDGNHIHAVWRDFAGDFGRDVLGEHRQRSDHE